MTAENGPNYPLSFFLQHPQRGPHDTVNSHNCSDRRITYGRVALHRAEGIMQDRALYSFQEARKLLGGISRNTIYRLLRTGELASIVIGCRRFISPAALADIVAKSTTTISPSLASTRSRLTAQAVLPPPLPTSRRSRTVRARN